MRRISDSYEKEQREKHGLHYHPRRNKCYCWIPRRFRTILISIILMIVIAILLYIARNERDYSLKQWPTVFTSLEDNEHLWHSPHPIRHENGSHIDERYMLMKYLGKGAEGSVSQYMDDSTGEVVVIKTYTGISRNPVPAKLADDFPDYVTKKNWQAEIEAGLHFGEWKNGNENAFVPVRDYFVLEAGPDDWEWAFVTPFIKEGTLVDLAKRTKVHERTPQKLDKIFRPAFEKLLGCLKLLHDKGFCHDDIKSDNIFVANATHWLVGDLGNVRHFDHPWHSTGRWKRENQWSDCVFNDVRRTFKTYMSFLRGSCGDRLDFDRAFYDPHQEWNKLYWAWMEQPLAVPTTLQLSGQYDPRHETEWKPDWSERLSSKQEACLRRKVDVELETMTLHLRPEDYWPVRGC